MKNSFLILIISIVTMGCQPTQSQTPTPILPTPQPTPAIPLEHPIQTLPLAGPIADPDAELSGLAWYNDTLILLPQYPHKFGKEDGSVFALSKQDILSYLNGTNTAPLEPTLIQFNAPGLRREIKGFQGYESITIYGNQVFLTIEAGEKEEMQGYLVSGIIEPDASQITIDVEKVVEVPLPIQSKGRSNEAIVIMDNSLIILFEANGTALNPNPVAQVFDFNLNLLRTISFPNLEYRLTDATSDNSKSFWVINQNNSNDAQNKFGQIVKLDYSLNGITLSNTPPIRIEFDNQISYKWEGLALLDNLGFLLVTDKEPTTMLAFFKIP